MSFFDKLRGLFAKASTNGDTTAAETEAISCHDALVLVHEYLDGELADVPEARVKAHFDVCHRCYPHLRLETVFRRAVRRAGRDEVAPAELKAKVVELLAQADAQG